MSELFSFKVFVKEPHPVNEVSSHYVVGPSKASAKRQALAMAGYTAPWPTHRISNVIELERIKK